MLTRKSKNLKDKINDKNKNLKEKKSPSLSIDTNNEYADFYKSYTDSVKNDSSKEEYHSGKGELESEFDSFSDDEVTEDVQEEYDYGDDTNYNELNAQKNKEKIKKILIIAGIVVAIAIIIMVIIVFIKSPRIKLNEEEITLEVGQSKNLSFEVLNTDNPIETLFSSTNFDVATVDENGNITAKGPGTTTIVVSYKIGHLKKKSECKVTVLEDEENKEGTGSDTEKETEKPPEEPKESKPENPQPPQPTQPTSCDKAPSLTVSLSNAKENTWTNKNVIINIDSSSDCKGTISLKYALNCSSSCKYQNISGKSVTISNTGTNTVSIVATDSVSKKEASKTVTLKIDKTPPVLSLLPDPSRTSFTPKSSNTKRMEICASCTDNESGCVSQTVCKEFSKTMSGQSLTGQDNAGNSGTTGKFNVIFK